jgi:hypothetical protein
MERPARGSQPAGASESSRRRFLKREVRAGGVRNEAPPYLRTISTVTAVTPSDTATSFFTTPRVSCQTRSV